MMLCPECAAAGVSRARMVPAHTADLAPTPETLFCESCQQDLHGRPVTILEIDHRQDDYIAAFYGDRKEDGR